MIRYRCQQCDHGVTGSAYRATCPECGGILSSTQQLQIGD